MLAAIDALLAQPIVLLAVLAVGAAIGIVVEKFFAEFERERRRAYYAGRNAGRGKQFGHGSKSGPTKEPEVRKADYAAEQLKIVSSAEFKSRPLLNKSEAKVFDTLDQAVVARNPGWQVMAQVSLGEFLASPDKDAYFAVNSKRVDFALMDENCCVRQVIEYQGSGHHTSNCAHARDAVKKAALSKAEIGYHEVVAGHTTPSELRALVEKLVPPVKTPEPVR
jgi:hypothetical protein